MKLFTAEQANHAETLAVAYSAYMTAHRSNDWSGVALWGRMLRRTQEATGVTLANAGLLDDLIKIAEAMEAQEAAAKRQEVEMVAA